eukprot:TRINITY_DN9044_c0_g1_i4.p1 TRINITY_DN9044_c0_g1~~TRINITY_DN9044_c0_g1_i4.p1  ORF type:complete len:102 (-),score=0.60 TRINITY_DN9044_c0_g1_i4:130-435(-)
MCIRDRIMCVSPRSTQPRSYSLSPLMTQSTNLVRAMLAEYIPTLRPRATVLTSWYPRAQAQGIRSAGMLKLTWRLVPVLTQSAHCSHHLACEHTIQCKRRD